MKQEQRLRRPSDRELWDFLRGESMTHSMVSTREELKLPRPCKVDMPLTRGAYARP
jgi:hypothetical protein